MRLVSTTSRTVAFLLPLPANCIHFGLDFVVRQFGLRPAPAIGIRQGGVKPFGQQIVEQRPAFLRGKLPRKINELSDSDGNR